MDIKRTIKQRGLTLAEVAYRMGITAPTLTNIIGGNITINSIRRIADAVGCKVTDFFDDENEVVDHPTQEVNLRCPHCGKEITITVK